jgi:NAD(P)-dependent dehydrogenase (short-subunit alcohol dehydrogenase family)
MNAAEVKTLESFQGRNAFITGGANGIGLGIAEALARAGCNVMIGDIESGSLAPAIERLQSLGVRAEGCELDVSDADSVREAAARAAGEFRSLHLLVNAAGVTLRQTPLVEVKPDQWDWLLGVNVFGALKVIEAFVPQLRHGEGGWIVNTSSLMGLQAKPSLRNAAYRITKFALIGLTDVLSLEFDLPAHGIGVSVLCPARVLTTLGRSPQRRPAHLGGPFKHHWSGNDFPAPADDLDEVLMPDRLGEITVDGILRGQRFIFTHRGSRDWLEERHAQILTDLEGLDDFNRRHPVP